MKFTHEVTYDAPRDTVLAMLADQGFREEVGAAQDMASTTVSVKRSGGSLTVDVDQERPADDIPSFARTFVGSSIRIVRHEAWSSDSEADLEVTIPDKPGQMVGTITLVEDGGSTTQGVAAEITVKIPLVGGRIEKLIADLLHKAMRAEEKVARDYLSR